MNVRRWFRNKPFKHNYHDGEHIITHRFSTCYGSGETKEEAVMDLLDTFAYDYRWLISEKDRLAPELTRELQGLTDFFTGRE